MVRKALIITENERRLNFLNTALVRDGCKVATCTPVEDDIIAAVGLLTPEIVVADCESNPRCAVDCRRLLETDCNLKEFLVIALFAKTQLDEADWSGIDDFLLEPYRGEELVARLRLLFFRTRGISEDDTLSIGPLIVDMQNHDVFIHGARVELTYKEYELLRFLATHRGRVFTRESLLDHVWGYDYYGGTRTVDVHIRRIRAKLYPSCDHLIETVRNVGYRFIT